MEMAFIRFKLPAVLFLAAVATPVLLAQSAPIGAADTNLSNQVTINGCSAGEPVILNGKVHVEYSVSIDATGANLFSITAANNLTGVGQNSTGQYLASDSSDYTVTSSAASADVSVELKSDLTSQSAGTTNMTLVQYLHITLDTTGNVDLQVQSNQTQCGN
jgi:hypothetical protein